MVRTHSGYMSPEYTMEGIFSVKSDTYSFGILLLEIVSGLKISAPPHLLTGYPSLIAYVSVTSSSMLCFSPFFFFFLIIINIYVFVKINKKEIYMCSYVRVSGMEPMERWDGEGVRRRHGRGEPLLA
jgi:serine/threonine protein kinase